MILDPQRNLPGIILLVTAVVLGAAALLLPTILSVERGAVAVEDDLPPIPEPPEAVESAAPEGDYASAILSKPIFYSDRQLPQTEVVEVDTGTENVDVKVAELDATVTGVIVTPDSRLAMVKVAGEQRSRILREGMSLDGDLAAWKVGRIEQRGVSFSASNGQVAKLELEVHDKALTAPAAPRPQPNRAVADANAPNATQEQKDRQASLAEEVRRRIAERRAQLRAQRQQQLKQQNEDENE